MAEQKGLFTYTTKIEASKTIAEIQENLERNGVHPLTSGEEGFYEKTIVY